MKTQINVNAVMNDDEPTIEIDQKCDLITLTGEILNVVGGGDGMISLQ